MNRHYVCSDLHGMWKLWEQIDAVCDETDTIFFLGDAIDRGPNGLKLMKTLLIDKRVQYIKGNHEDMLINAYYENDFWLVNYNGGSQTLKDFQRLSDDDQKWLITKLKNLLKQIEYTNKNGAHIVMNHTGYNPEQYTLPGMREDPYLWDRRQIVYPWKGNEKTLIVHGHTPTPDLVERLNEVSMITNQHYDIPTEIEEVKVINYCDGHKFDIDLGAFATGKAALLDLDTLEVQYFTTEMRGR